MKIVTPDDIRYTEQAVALNEIAAKLGVVAYRPDFHGSKGDKNTVLFYTQEDEAHSRSVNRQPVHYSWSEATDLKKRGGVEIQEKCIYRDSFWQFENSDVSGLLDMGCANRGKLDLLSFGWKERLEGHIGLALLRKRQHQYLHMTGGWGALREADKQYNDFNRSIIAYMKKAYGRLYLGSVNIYDESRRKRVCDGEEGIYEEYTGQEIYNFHCDFAVPEKDERLEELIRGWNSGSQAATFRNVDKITSRVDEIGGEHFVWF